MVIDRERRSINGKLLGMYYRFDGGKTLYLAFASGAKSRAYSPQHNAYILPTDTIRAAERGGATYIGIAHKIANVWTFYVTTVENFLDEPSERHFDPKQPSRRLGRDRFMVVWAKKGKGRLTPAIELANQIK